MRGFDYPKYVQWKLTKMILYRLVGLKELELIDAYGYTAFHPLLPEQPIFNPVFNFAYAGQIARDWNATTAPFAGFVSRF